MNKLHICMAGDNGVHFQKWIRSLADIEEYKISVVTLNKKEELPGVDYYYLKKITNTKADYILNAYSFRKLIKQINPDILHSHYASGYGFIGALSGFRPYFVSVWGDDVISFPGNILGKEIIKFTFKRADRIFATGKYLRDVTSPYTNKEINIINFGIDTNLFSPAPVKKDFFYIGTVKSLHYQYGIDTLISSFKLLEDTERWESLKLLIVGDGSLRAQLKKLVQDLNIEDKVIFIGRVKYEDVPHYYNMLDIFVAVSVSESFGVAVLEAQGCEKPVIVSDVGGLPEVVQNNITGFIVPPRDPKALAEKLLHLLNNQNLVNEMGRRGRSFVVQNFQWKRSVDEMCSFYNFYK